MPPSLLARQQKRQQIGQLAPVNCPSSPAGITDTLLGCISSMSSRRKFATLMNTRRQHEFVRRVFAYQAVVRLAVLGRHLHRLITAYKAGGGKTIDSSRSRSVRIWPIRERSGPTLPPR